MSGGAGSKSAPAGYLPLVALPIMRAFRAVLRPIGYLMFAVSLLALSSAAHLLGEDHELGFFSGRLSRMLWRYPEVTRRGVQMAWLAWGALFVVALSPLDPIASSWDEVALGAVALAFLWHRLVGGHRAEH
jgi:hypothetical protein